MICASWPENFRMDLPEEVVRGVVTSVRFFSDGCPAPLLRLRRTAVQKLAASLLVRDMGAASVVACVPGCPWPATVVVMGCRAAYLRAACRFLSICVPFKLWKAKLLLKLWWASKPSRMLCATPTRRRSRAHLRCGLWAVSLHGTEKTPCWLFCGMICCSTSPVGFEQSITLMFFGY